MIAVVGISASSRADLDRAARRARHQPADRRAGRHDVRRGRDAARRVGADDLPDRAGHRRSPPPARSPTPRSTATTASRRPRPAASRCWPRTSTCSARSAPRSPTAPGSTRPPPATRPWCSDAAAAQRLGIGAAGPQVLARRPVVHRGRHPRAGAAGARARLRRADRLAGGGRRTWASTATRPRVYTRSDDAQVEAVRAVLAATANPENPNEVEVSRPSDALAARRATDAHVHRAAARAGRGGAAGRRDRRGQHDGHLGAGAPRGDRAAALPRCDPRADPYPVRRRVLDLVLGRRGRWRRDRLGCYGLLLFVATVACRPYRRGF